MRVGSRQDTLVHRGRPADELLLMLTNLHNVFMLYELDFCYIINKNVTFVVRLLISSNVTMMLFKDK